MPQPGYRKLYETGELRTRVKKAYRILKDCELCPHHCHVNRIQDEKGYCNTGREIKIASFGPHFGEEPPLVGRKGSGTIFFSNCNLRCVYCQNYDISQEEAGRDVSVKRVAEMMLSLQDKGCHNINFVTPSHMIHTVLAGVYNACKQGLNIPLVYNSGGYDDLQSLKLLDNVIDIYMPDVKYADEEIALKYSGIKEYFNIVKQALKEMQKQVGVLKTKKGIAYRGLLIRHLVLPSKLAGSKMILKFIAEEVSGDSYVNIMNQYHPVYKAYNYSELNRRISHKEYREVLNYARELGLNLI